MTNSLGVVFLKKSIGIIFLFTCFLANAVAENKCNLVFAVHPYRSAETILGVFQDFVNPIETALECKIKVLVSKDYEAHISNIGKGVADIAYIGPAAYVRLVAEFGSFRLLGQQSIKGSSKFFGHIVVHNQSQLQSLQQLTGKRFAFGDTVSTMSHLVPRYLLMQANLRHDDYQARFLGSHDNVALAVLSGDYDAGAVKDAVFLKYKSLGLRSLAKTPLISEHLLLVSQRVSQQQYEQLKIIILNYHTLAFGVQKLNEIKKGFTQFESVSDDDYDNLRIILKKLSEAGIE